MTTEQLTEAEAAAQETQQRREQAADRMYQMVDALEEAGLTLGDLLLSLDTAGYERLGQAFSDQLDMQPVERVATVRRSRLYWQRDPIADRTLGMWTEFAFGAPWQITAQDKAFQTVIDEFLGARYNRRQLSSRAMQRNSNALLVDGERWFAFFVAPSGRQVRVRTFDPLEVAEVLSNPDDRDEPWYYRRTWTDIEGKVHTRFYRDWDFTDDAGKPRSDPHPRMRDSIADAGLLGDVDFKPRDDVWVTGLTINTLGQRGYPLLTSGLDWLRAFREFMRDRSALNSARAQFAYKATTKGGQGAVDRLQSAFEAVNPADPTEAGLRRPRAGVFVGNEGVDLNQMNMQTDGASALNDMRALRLMALMPSGIPEHLAGDVSTANLAVATEVRGPLERMLGNYQNLWAEDFYEDAFYHLAEWQGFRGDTTVDIDPPPILKRDLAIFASAFVAIAGTVPAIRSNPAIIAMVLTELGVNNVDEVMAELEPLLGAELDNIDDAVQEAVRTLREARQ